MAAIALTALVGAGCSSSPAATTSAATDAASSMSQEVKFAQCMRSNGVGNFPDPSASGRFTIDGVANGFGVDINSAVFQRALSSCKTLEPAGFKGTTRSARQQVAALRFAQCMRDNGVSDFPDPSPNSPLVDTTRIPSANTPGGRSALHAAMQRCASFSAAAGVTGGR